MTALGLAVSLTAGLAAAAAAAADFRSVFAAAAPDLAGAGSGPDPCPPPLATRPIFMFFGADTPSIRTAALRALPGASAGCASAFSFSIEICSPCSMPCFEMTAENLHGINNFLTNCGKPVNI
ncbi:hypothetical protein [Leisingera sp. ANG-M1]|uniref:hypothetical protein n=1 Tax=Leisingera sp. ANG-M1 TaxID=1577895 RepID=UPI001F4C8A46|nr:hypothetical protein [Leisingera sp. ANG-M1]